MKTNYSRLLQQGYEAFTTTLAREHDILTFGALDVGRRLEEIVQQPSVLTGIVLGTFLLALRTVQDYRSRRVSSSISSSSKI